MLNTDLIELQNLTPDDVTRLQNLHTMMKVMLSASIDDVSVTTEEYVNAIECLEFIMQEAWGFNKDPTYHQHWFRDPKCKCPYLDNLELIGVDRKVISQNCKLHGSTNSTQNKEKQ